jgi:hypothetical protein
MTAEEFVAFSRARDGKINYENSDTKPMIKLAYGEQ